MSINRAYQETQTKRRLESEGKSVFDHTNDNIEWASWTWNPVTGCQHGCPYCYARDIAARFYCKGGFEPKFHPDRQTSPANTLPQNHLERENALVCLLFFMGRLWDWGRKSKPPSMARTPKTVWKISRV